MSIHIAKKHKKIEQIDGNSSECEDTYAESYWESDYMGTSYHSYLNAVENIKTSDISLEEKHLEYERAKGARKEAFLKDGLTEIDMERSIPPWSS